MSEDQVDCCLSSAEALGVSQVAFEGGEPFLRYPTLLRCVDAARTRDLAAGAVTNGFWASDMDRALSLLHRLKEAGLTSLMISTDDFHGDEEEARCAGLAVEAACELDIPVVTARTSLDGVMFRGRAAAELASQSPQHRPELFTSCPHEDLANPTRVHIDAWGCVHLCQGLTMGRVSESRPLEQLVDEYRPHHHPVVGPLLSGGPLALAQTFDLDLDRGYADACHLCYRAREAIRDQFPEYLGPGPMYGMIGERGHT